MIFFLLHRFASPFSSPFTKFLLQKDNPIIPCPFRSPFEIPRAIWFAAIRFRACRIKTESLQG